MAITVVVAVFCTLFIGVEPHVVVTLLVAIGLGFFNGAMACWMLVAMLSGPRATRILIQCLALAGVLATLVGLMFVGRSAPSGAMLVILGYAVFFGAVLLSTIVGSAFLIANFLRHCRWRCHRQEGNT